MWSGFLPHQPEFWQSFPPQSSQLIFVTCLTCTEQPKRAHFSVDYTNPQHMPRFQPPPLSSQNIQANLNIYKQWRLAFLEEDRIGGELEINWSFNRKAFLLLRQECKNAPNVFIRLFWMTLQYSTLTLLDDYFIFEQANWPQADTVFAHYYVSMKASEGLKRTCIAANIWFLHVREMREGSIEASCRPARKAIPIVALDRP